MKTYRILGIEINFSFSIRRVKRLTFDLPDWADDTCITTSDVNNNKIPHKIKYYKGSTRYYIDLPKCIDAQEVSLTPMYGIVNNDRVRMTNRKIVVDIYY
jgi:hypothetical protein